MPRIGQVCWKVLECIFEKDGFVFKREEGDHRSYVKEGVSRPVVIPKYKEVLIRIIQSNMKTAGMTRGRYFEYLKVCKQAA
jgi:predicted RNA binding protein YcfA (HicA-like mRNA interferase family)